MGHFNPIAVIVAIILGGVWFGLFTPATAGWGYATPTRAASFWYFGGPSVYTERPSVRTGSVGGPGGIGGAGGK